MSLYKQLWLAIILLMAIAFSGSFLLATKSAQNYLSEQLQLKNIDNANSLALSLSQQTDLILKELLISAQFDNGHYQYITLTGTEGETIVNLTNEDTNYPRSAPVWFMNLFPIEATEGISKVTNGWRQIGTLSLKSNSYFAHHEMWVSTQLMLLYFLFGALISGLIGSYILKIILTPLYGVVDQAKAIGERRFITIKAPKTREYRLLVSSMNSLSERVQKMLESAGRDLNELRLEAETDTLTGLLNRGPFLQRLNTLLRNDSSSCSGSIVLLRLQRLAEMNRNEGRDIIDTLLKNLGASLLKEANQYEGGIAGRLNGSDFVLLLPSCEKTQSLAQLSHNSFLHITTQMKLKKPLIIPAAGSLYQPKDSLQTLLTRLDSALAAAETEQRSCLKIADLNSILPESCSTNCWENLIFDALKDNRGELRETPIINKNNNIQFTHLTPQITTTQGEQITSEELHPWLSRLDMAPKMDIWCLKQALRKLTDTPPLNHSTKPLALSLSSQLLSNEVLSLEFLQLLESATDKAHLLRFGFPEYGAYQHLDKLQKFSSRLQALGCNVGIEQVGPEIASIGKLAGLGIDYVMIDESMVRGIDKNNTQQIFIRGLCSMSHSIGLSVYASGVSNEQELTTIIKLGVNGATNPS